MKSRGVVSHDAGREPWKLVPLEVHGRVRNAKIAKKYFSMSKWGVQSYHWKANKKSFPTS